MKKVLIICPTPRDFRELPRLASGKYEIIFDHLSKDWTDAIEASIYPEPTDSCTIDILKSIETLYDHYRQQTIDGIASSDDYPGSIIAAILAGSKKLPGADVCTLLTCQHKYYSRIAQKRVAAHAVPFFQSLAKQNSITNELPFPLFVKPSKSVFSANTHKIYNYEQLRKLLLTSQLPQEFFKPFHDLLKRYTSFEPRADYFIAEQCVSGIQGTFEGFAYNGVVQTIGIVDSIMFPGTFSFERFEYPSSLPLGIQQRISQLAQKVMREIGFYHGIFNIEYMYNPDDTIFIIEINPRMASQFADLYEKVDGINSYEILLELACGVKPQIKKLQGRYPFAASCVLRTFQNYYVEEIPSAQQLQMVYNLFPDARIEICISAKQNLSQTLQDSNSFRYGVINLGGSNRTDVLQQFEQCKQLLPFQFKLK